jgi:hypothetical protein
MGRARLRFVLGLGFLWLIGSACGGEARIALLSPSGGACGTVYLAGVESTFDLDPGDSTAGASPELVFEMYIPGSLPDGKILLTRTVVITLPAAFGFEGFDALGAGAQIGAWDFDYSNPNLVWDPLSPLGYDYRIPHFAIDFDTAYADTLLNGSYDAGVDSIVEHTTGAGGAHVFSILMPSGGTNNGGFDPDDPCSYFDTDTRFTLPAGIVRLPATPGSYEVTVVATSVDPDTGDADDGLGAPPTVYQRPVEVFVPEPSASLAAAVAGGVLALVRLRRRER